MLFSCGNIRKADLSLQLCFYYFGHFHIHTLKKKNQADIILEIVFISPGFFTMIRSEIRGKMMVVLNE